MGDSALFTTTAPAELKQLPNSQAAGQEDFITSEEQGTIRNNTFSRASDGSEQEHAVMQQLKPTDRGLAAWRVLIAAFVFEALLWGRVLFLSVPSLR